jgi:peptidoglycan/xylan/chitin deacetylase (PgdA/CDA1 family)
MLFPNVPDVVSLLSLLAATLVLNAQALAIDTIANATDRQAHVSYGVYIHHCYIPGTIALTFDDGPYIYTEELLDILAQYGAKATFFVNGHNLAGNEWLIQRVVDEGHQLASHTYVKHPNDSLISSLQEFISKLT